jgi:general secretion pathway protein H
VLRPGRERRAGSVRAGRGFTLIELLVVMVIIAIAFFAVEPTFMSSVHANQNRAALRDLAGLLGGARTQAVARGRLVRVIVAPGQAEVWAEVQSDPMLDRSQFDVLPLYGQAQLSLPQYVQITDLQIGGAGRQQRDEAVMYFYPDGRSTGASLALECANGEAFTIEVSPVTGKVVIYG